MFELFLITLLLPCGSLFWSKTRLWFWVLVIFFESIGSFCDLIRGYYDDVRCYLITIAWLLIIVATIVTIASYWSVIKKAGRKP